MYITGLASNEIFSPSNKIHREVGRAKHLSAPRAEKHTGRRVCAPSLLPSPKVTPVLSRKGDSQRLTDGANRHTVSISGHFQPPNFLLPCQRFFFYYDITAYCLSGLRRAL